MKKQFKAMIGLGLIGLSLLAALLLLVQKPEPGLSEVRNLSEQIQMVRDCGVDAEAYSAEHASQTVLTVGDMTLSNERFNYSFWSCYNAYVNSLDGALPFEETQPLSSQKRENGITWEQYFVQQALEEAILYLSVEQAAAAAGFSLSEETSASLEQEQAGITQYASALSMSVDTLCQSVFGPPAGAASYFQYLAQTYLVQDYCRQLFEGIVCTEEEITAYFQAHAAEYARDYGIGKETPNPVNIRYIYIAAEAAAAAADASRMTAEAVLDVYRDNGGGEALFAALAKENSYDRSSAVNGGLLEKLFPGEADASIDEWCFAPERQSGDVALIECQDGCYLVYFVGTCEESAWFEAARADLCQERYQEALRAMQRQYDVKVDFSSLEYYIPELHGASSQFPS